MSRVRILLATLLLTGCTVAATPPAPEPTVTPSSTVSATPTTPAPASSTAPATTRPSPTSTPKPASLLEPASGWTTVTGLQYGGGTADLYLPKNDSSPDPLIIYIPGGGWETTSGQACLPQVLTAMKLGYAVMCVRSYPLAPANVWPAQLVAVKQAVRYARSVATARHIWPDKVAVWGVSAGAQLVAEAGVTNGDPAYEQGSNLGYSSSVQAVIADFGPSDFLTWPQVTSEPYVARVTTQLFGGTVADQQDAARDASPALRVTPATPPMALLAGTRDTVVPVAQVQELKDALTAAGVPVVLNVGNLVHADASVYTQAWMSGVKGWLELYLRP